VPLPAVNSSATFEVRSVVASAAVAKCGWPVSASSISKGHLKRCHAQNIQQLFFFACGQVLEGGYIFVASHLGAASEFAASDVCHAGKAVTAVSSWSRGRVALTPL